MAKIEKSKQTDILSFIIFNPVMLRFAAQVLCKLHYIFLREDFREINF